MCRRRLTVFPWGMLETTEYGDEDDEFVVEPIEDDEDEPPTCVDR